MRNFRKLIVWQKGMDIAVDSCKLANKLPYRDRFSFGSQLTRSAISIPANIAEGNGRSSDKEKKRFLEISMGSCNELESILIVLKKLKQLPEDQVDKTLIAIEEEQKLLSAFIKKLTANSQ